MANNSGFREFSILKNSKKCTKKRPGVVVTLKVMYSALQSLAIDIYPFAVLQSPSNNGFSKQCARKKGPPTNFG